MPDENVRRKQCACCGNPKPLEMFYKSNSLLYALDGKVPVCKGCILKHSLDEKTGEIIEENFKNILKQIDKPFYKDALQSAIEQVKNSMGIKMSDVKYYGERIIRVYMKNIGSLSQYSSKNYEDSEKDGFIQKNSKYMSEINDVNLDIDLARIKNEEVVQMRSDVFEVTQETLDMFGEGFTRLEYKKMLKKYEDMTKTYVVQTNLHKEALLTYVRFKVKEEIATAKGNVQEAQKWYAAAQDAAEKAKLTPKQLSKEDLQGGLANFSDIFAAVEGAKERIRIFPEFKYQPKDAADFIIWCYVNYERNLNNMPEVAYKDIYKFYDEKKQEYVEMYGDPYEIFTDDTTEGNRETIEKFITIPNEFKDGDRNG